MRLIVFVCLMPINSAQHVVVDLGSLMEIVPAGTLDPTPTLYNTALYSMAGLLTCAVICNSMIRFAFGNLPLGFFSLSLSLCSKNHVERTRFFVKFIFTL